MAYTRSVREIPLDQEPMAAAIAAVLPDPDESPGSTDMRWDNATEDQLRLLALHPDALMVVGVAPVGEPEIDEGSGGSRS